ncbi:hypothetical protein [Micromonospora sp. MH99]|uniref:hypothetical protein n=1 Tax=Micromonospora sp. MH99 TaxID=1945510 RepID=UPI001F205343|nr:hypothetical protein [Micromonospora sp. MH99]MCF0092533.1 hypothetical protein [Micromonospora sp. MH99]
MTDQAEQHADELPPFQLLVQSIKSSVRRLQQALQANPTLENGLRNSLTSIAAQGDDIFESVLDVIGRLSREDGSILRRMMRDFDQIMQRDEGQFLKAKPKEAILLVGNFTALASEVIRRAIAEGPRPHERRHLDFQFQRMSALLSSVKLLQEHEEVKQVGAEVRQIADDAQEAAGQAATSGIATFYQERADTERRRHFTWNALLLASTAAGVWLGWFVVFRTADSGLTVHELARATIALPVLLLAAYSSRQANYHRNSESDARSIAVQLKTIRAYSDALDTSARQEILRLFGTKIFGPSADTPFPTAPTAAAEGDAGEGFSADMIQVLRALAQGNKSSGPA